MRFLLKLQRKINHSSLTAMRFANSWCWSLALLLAATACDDTKLDTGAMRQEMNDRKIKRVTTAQLLDQTMILGDTVAQRLDLAFEDAMRPAVLAGVESCVPVWQKLTDSLARGDEYSIVRHAFATTDTTKLLPKEAGIFNAYRLASSGANPNVQLLPGDSLLYNRAIVLQNNCLHCHGMDNQRTLYKTDTKGNRITGQQPGQIMGVYSVIFPKKTVIKNGQF